MWKWQSLYRFQFCGCKVQPSPLTCIIAINTWLVLPCCPIIVLCLLVGGQKGLHLHIISNNFWWNFRIYLPFDMQKFIWKWQHGYAPWKLVLLPLLYCFNGKGRFHITSEKANVNAKLYVDTLLLKLVGDCKTLLPWLHFPTARCTCTLHVCHKTGSPPTAPDSSASMSGHQTLRTWIHCIIMSGEIMPECLHMFQLKPKKHRRAEGCPAVIWDELPQNSINKAVLSFTKRPQAWVKSGDEHFEDFV